MRKVIGITGGIAAGKSTLSRRLESKGVTIIDADKVAREVLKKGSIAYDMVKEEFPACFTEGELNRKKLGSIVFKDEAQLKKLNSITHPQIVSIIKERLDSLCGICAIDAALLFETGLNELCDCVWCVSADMDTRTERIIQRDGLTRQEAVNRINSQMSDEIRRGLSDITLYTDNGFESFYRQIDENYKLLTESFTDV